MLTDPEASQYAKIRASRDQLVGTVYDWPPLWARNAPLSDEELQAARRNLALARSQLKAIEALGPLSLRVENHFLGRARLWLENKISLYENLGLRSFPNEILVLIFQHAYADVEPQHRFALGHPLRNISQVCRRWHWVVMGNPLLWTEIIQPPSSSHAMLDLMGLQLVRSANAPLSIRMRLSEDDADDAEFIAVVGRAADRWHDADLILSPFSLDALLQVGPFPKLKKLQFDLACGMDYDGEETTPEDPPPLGNVVFPALEELDICLADLECASFVLQTFADTFSRLRNINFDKCSAAQIIPILPSFEPSCRVSFSRNKSEAATLPTNTSAVVLRVYSLEFDACDSAFIHTIFGHIMDAPFLKSLKITAPGKIFACDNLIRALHDARFKLDTLHLCASDARTSPFGPLVHFADIKRILRAASVRSVTALTLHMSFSEYLEDVVSMFHKETRVGSRTPVLVPALRSLAILDDEQRERWAVDPVSGGTVVALQACRAGVLEELRMRMWPYKCERGSVRWRDLRAKGLVVYESV
ncbi:F-box domain-containing protein [Mycena chlorophos]|uniref:F-box domain-containing protein n=1 Tax=Mycena chlorophos TaxID=658473 RepID=A0A8H6RZ41_MYCCL|nr:F-box domain-containing protein [Mycena chlorophos]